MIGGKLTNQVKCYYANNIFFTCFVPSQICGDWSQQVFFAQITSCAMPYDVIYYPFPYFPINSQYLKTWGVESPGPVTCENMSCDLRRRAITIIHGSSMTTNVSASRALSCKSVFRFSLPFYAAAVLKSNFI